MNYLLTFKD